MSGSYIDASAPTHAADAAAIEAQIGPATARFENAQAAAAAFVAEHGAAVIGGHSEVGYLPPMLAVGE